MQKFKDLKSNLTRISTENNRLHESNWESYRDRAIQESLDQPPLDVPTMTPEEIAKTHGVPVSKINAQLKMGIEVEAEHTTHRDKAREIALDHLKERPDYYTRLKKYVEVNEEITSKETVYEAKDAHGRHIIDDAVAQAGAEHAEHLHHTGQLHDYHTGRRVDLELSRKKRDKKLLPAARAAEDAARKPARAAVEACVAFEKKHGVHPVQAWEAHHGKRWPYYRVDTGGGRPTHVKKSDAVLSEGIEHDSLESQYIQHYNLFRKHEHLTPTDPSHKPHKEYHRTQLSQIYVKLSPEERKRLPRLSEDTERERLAHAERMKPAEKVEHPAIPVKKPVQGAPIYAIKYPKPVGGYRPILKETESFDTYKVGDEVIPKIGPHKGQPHTVIHVHDTGHVNIKPVHSHGRHNRYPLGAARAHPDQLTRVPTKKTMQEEILMEEKQYVPPKDHVKQLKDLGFTHAPETQILTHKAENSFKHPSTEHYTGVVNNFRDRGYTVHSQVRRKYGRHINLDSPDKKHHVQVSTDNVGKFRGTQVHFHPPISPLVFKEGKALYSMTQAEADAYYKKHPEKLNKKIQPGTRLKSLKGVNNKTVQEAFQAAKDKKTSGAPQKELQDALPTDGAKEPNQQVPGSPPKPEKTNNAPPPARNAKKVQVKGPGPEDTFQADPIVTPLTTMPDRGNGDYKRNG